MDKDEALKLALEALEMADELEEGYGVDFKKYELKVDKDIRAKYEKAITAIKQALAAPTVQKPVAWQVHPFDYGIGHQGVYARTSLPQQVEAWKRKGWNVQPLYTTPLAAQRQWVGLTTEDMATCIDEPAWDLVLRKAEQILKEKNNGN